MLGVWIEATHQAIEFVLAEVHADVLHEEFDCFVVDVAEVFFIYELENLGNVVMKKRV
jgi:hypothetical protein